MTDKKHKTIGEQKENPEEETSYSTKNKRKTAPKLKYCCKVPGEGSGKEGFIQMWMEVGIRI